MAGPRLIADVGGTNARFALAAVDGAISDIVVLPVAGHARFADALAAYLGQTGARPSAAAIAAAGPVSGDSVTLTNAPWTISAGAVAAQLGGAPVQVLNDLQAVALALPDLGRDDADPILPGAVADRLPRLAINVGTGFGAALAIPTTTGWTALPTEAGHMSLDPHPLCKDRTTIEALFSGPGYQRLFDRSGSPSKAEPARRTAYAHLLGRISSDLVLATGAWGGVWFCGGVLSDFRNTIPIDAFTSGFLDKGPMAERMRDVPVAAITIETPAFCGLLSVLG